MRHLTKLPLLFNRISLFTVSKSWRSSSGLNSVKRGSIRRDILEPTYAEVIMEGYKNSKFPPWEDIVGKICTQKETLSENNKGSIHNAILTACFRQNMLDAAMSYYKYVMDKGEKLSHSEYSCLILLLGNNMDRMKEYEELIKLIYKSMRQDLMHLGMVQHEYFGVFSQVESCWKDLVSFSDKMNVKVITPIANAAFSKYGDSKIGWEILERSPTVFNDRTMIAYLEYCIKLANEHKFNPDLLSKLVNFLNENAFPFPISEEISNSLNCLINTLNDDRDHKYVWTLTEITLNSMGHCGNCNLPLKKLELTDEEFFALRRALKKSIVRNKLLNTAISDEEINKYLSKLEKLKYYNMVIDGLNLSAHKSNVTVLGIIEKLLKLNFKILVVARHHLRFTSLYNHLQQTCQVFLTADKSNDDIYILYAAMAGGKQTCFLSNDYYRGYSQYLPSEEYRASFFKWLTCRIYQINNGIEKPFDHGNLPQLTLSAKDPNSNGRYVWHLALSTTAMFRRPRPHEHTKWLCLQATPKKME